MSRSVANETLLGTVTKLLWSNKNDQFRVLEWIPDIPREGRPNQREKLLGYWDNPRIGARIEVVGFWQKRNGTQEIQFRAQHIQEILPEDASGLLAWLEGGAVKGIGKVTAKKLVERFGTELPQILDTNLDAIALCGIGKKHRERIRQGWATAQATRIILQFLRRVGIGSERSRSVWKRFERRPEIQGDPSALVARLEDNPYWLTEVPGIGFVLADQAAGKLGIPADSSYRIDAGIRHVFGKWVEEGHVWMPVQDMLRQSTDLLGVPFDRVRGRLEAQIEGNRFVQEGNLVASRGMAKTEHSLAEEIVRLCAPIPQPIPVLLPSGFVPDPDQESALQTILRSGFVVLTGGPGMGKTTLIRACVLSAKAEGLRVLLCAPTGRAAKRMSEATGHPAATIHRALGWGMDGPQYHKEHPLSADWVIVDEVSMLDQFLANALLSAIKTGTRVLFVGDPNQLPSVGPGRVLGDILDAGVVPVAHLRKIFRQAEFSGIPLLAQAVLDGKPVDPQGLDGVRYVAFPSDIPSEGKTGFILNILSEHYRETGKRVQVLSPMKSGPLGTKAMNMALRDLYNPNTGQAQWKWYRVGDLVIQTRNNYDLEVFNGDMGIVSDIRHSEDGVVLFVDFDGNVVEYAQEDTDDLEFAWALTVHKSQGGQFPSVCVISTTDHFVMLKRNLVYTGITRAESELIWVSSSKASAIMRQHTGITHRETRLTALLQSLRASAPLAKLVQEQISLWQEEEIVPDEEGLAGIMPMGIAIGDLEEFPQKSVEVPCIPL